MARTKVITPEALTSLGVDALAAVLSGHAETDPVLRMLLAGNEGPGRLAAEIDKRIQTIGRSRSFVDWEKRKPLVQELEHLRATTLATQSPEGAIERLWAFIGIADSVIERVGDGVGDVEKVFGQAMDDLGRLSAKTHATFVAQLRKVHGRKYGFWGLIDQKER